jgi:hypothetical protein
VEVVLVARAAEVLAAAHILGEAASAELLILEAESVGFTRPVRAELSASERVEAELDSERGGTHRICPPHHHRVALQLPADRWARMDVRQPTHVRLHQ